MKELTSRIVNPYVDNTVIYDGNNVRIIYLFSPPHNNGMWGPCEKQSSWGDYAETKNPIPSACTLMRQAINQILIPFRQLSEWDTM